MPVTQSRSTPTEVIASANGTANLRAQLSSAPAIRETLIVEVNEGAGWVKWDRRDNLLYGDGTGGARASGPTSRDYYVQFDENDVCYVCFGDGVNGMRPPVGLNNIRATYSVGGGAAGNVAALAIAALGPGTKLPLVDLPPIPTPPPAAPTARTRRTPCASARSPIAPAAAR